MTYRKSILTLLSSLLMAILVIAAAFAEAATPRWGDVSPAEIHRTLWEGKTKAMLDRRLPAEAAALDVSTQTNYDVKFYDVFIRVNDTTEIIYGRVGFDVVAVEDGVATMDIDLYSNMVIDSIVGTSGPLAFGRNGHIVVTNLGQTYNTGDPISLDFYYHGHPIEGGFQAFAFDARSGYKVMTTLSEPYFARTWWPCKDRMDDKPDSMHIAIEARSDYYVASNGTLDSIVNSTANTDTYYYSVGYPIVSYLFSLAISDYTVWMQDYIYNGGLDTMPVVHAVYPENESYSIPRWGITPQAIAVLSDAYGPYPYLDEKYGHANFEWGGGMEHQTMTSMTGSSFGYSEPVVVHELGHQWWGDMITCESWRDIWLNEGWASYSEALYYEALDGAQAYRDYMVGMDYTFGGTIYLSDTSSVNAIFGSIVYDKGAWVCHMLRGILGDSAFFAGVDDWYNSEFQFASATSVDFENVWEQSSGQDLTWFFEDWLHGQYRPEYNHFLKSEPAVGGGYNTYLVIKQVQSTNPTVFRMPIEIVLNYAGGADTTVRVFNDARKQLFWFHTSQEVTSVDFDPDLWILRYENDRSWELFIVTPDSALSEGMQYVSYLDTIESRGGSTENTVTITSGALPTGLTIDNNGIISGTTEETGTFSFSVNFDDDHTSWFDDADFNLTITAFAGLPGDVTDDGAVDISDLTLLVNYLFLEGPAPSPLVLADVNADCDVDISDLTYMVNYLFLLGPEPQAGCAK